LFFPHLSIIPILVLVETPDQSLLCFFSNPLKNRGYEGKSCKFVSWFTILHLFVLIISSPLPSQKVERLKPKRHLNTLPQFLFLPPSPLSRHFAGRAFDQTKNLKNLLSFGETTECTDGVLLFVF
jgi:hypothetical protein